MRTAPLPLLSFCLLGACVPVPEGGDLLGGTDGDNGGGGGSAPQVSGPGSAGLEAISGGRLKAQWIDGPAGSRQFQGWYDTELEAMCHFEVVNGLIFTPQCVPDDVLTASSEAFDLYSGSSYFLTDECDAEGRVLFASSSSECERYGAVRVRYDGELSALPRCNLPGSTQAVTYYAATVIDPTTTALYRYGVPDGGGTCCGCYEADADAFDDYGVLVKLGDELTADNTPFAVGTLTRDP